jgi:hypothetical protein
VVPSALTLTSLGIGPYTLAVNSTTKDLEVKKDGNPSVAVIGANAGGSYMWARTVGTQNKGWL